MQFLSSLFHSRANLLAGFLLLTTGANTSTATEIRSHFDSRMGDYTVVQQQYDTTVPALAEPDNSLLAHVGPGIRPGTGSQLYSQRQVALAEGYVHTRISPDSFSDHWVNATGIRSPEQWVDLLAEEAAAMAQLPEEAPLSIVVGDSISQWWPADLLPQDRYWLNQGISGDTTAGILSRLSSFAQTRPDTIHLMAGINDLKNGASDVDVLLNLAEIMRRLREQHPEAHVIVQSILPTRRDNLPGDRIRALNAQIEAIAREQQVTYVDLYPVFSDDAGNLRAELTTDGLHLNHYGYEVWQLAITN